MTIQVMTDTVSNGGVSLNMVSMDGATPPGETPAYPADGPEDAATRAMLERSISLAARQRDAATDRDAASGTISYLRSSR